MIRMRNDNFYGSANLRIGAGDPVLNHFSVVMKRDERGAELLRLAEALLPGLKVRIATYGGSPELVIIDPLCRITTPRHKRSAGKVVALIIPDKWDRSERIVLVDTMNPLEVQLGGEMDTPERRAALAALGFSELPGYSR